MSNVDGPSLALLTPVSKRAIRDHQTLIRNDQTQKKCTYVSDSDPEWGTVQVRKTPELARFSMSQASWLMITPFSETNIRNKIFIETTWCVTELTLVMIRASPVTYMHELPSTLPRRRCSGQFHDAQVSGTCSLLTKNFHDWIVSPFCVVLFYAKF